MMKVTKLCSPRMEIWLVLLPTQNLWDRRWAYLFSPILCITCYNKLWSLTLLRSCLFSFDVMSLTSQVLRIHLEHYDSSQEARELSSATVTTKERRSSSLGLGIFAGAVAVTSIGVLVYLKRSKAWSMLGWIWICSVYNKVMGKFKETSKPVEGKVTHFVGTRRKMQQCKAT